MQKTKLGISVGLLGALTYLLGYFGGSLVLTVLVGYILMFEDNLWLKKAAVKAIVVYVGLYALAGLIGLIPGALNVVFDFFGLFNLSIYLSFITKLFDVISTFISFVRTALMLLLGVKALSQGTIAIPVVDRFVEKHFAE